MTLIAVVGSMFVIGAAVFFMAPLLPYRANGNCGAKQLSCFWSWSCAIGWPFVNDSGIGLPDISASFGL